MTDRTPDPKPAAPELAGGGTVAGGFKAAGFKAGGLRQLVAVRGCSALSYYAFTPFVPLWARHHLDIPVAAAGGALALSLLATRAGGLLLPPVIDLLGGRLFIRLSYGLIAMSYLVIASQKSVGVVELWVVFGLIGLLQSGSTVALKAGIAALGADYHGVRGFAALSMAINAGSALGPVLGALLLDAGQFALPVLAAGLVAVAAVLPMPAGSVRAGGQRAVLLVRPGRQLAGFLALASLTWLAYAVALDAMPTVAGLLVDRRVVAAAFALNALLVVAGQPLVTRWLIGRPNDQLRALVLANLLAGVGLLVVAGLPWAGSVALLVGVLIFSGSELIWAPLYDAGTLARAGRLSSAAAFGLAGCVFGVAESGAAWTAIAIAGGSNRVAAVFVAGGGAALVAALLLAAWSARVTTQPVEEAMR